MSFERQGIEKLRITVGQLELHGSFVTRDSASFDLLIGSWRAGWIDVHFPCQGHIKLRVRGALPADRLKPEIINELVDRVRAGLSIPANEAYEALFFKPENSISVAQPINREGETDRLVSSVKWKLPPREAE